LESQTDKHLLEEARLLASLKELQRVLTLPTLPGRIEAYDISNIQGTNPVGSMVVFDYARPKKQDYRKFKISAKGGSASGGNPPIPKPDDFAMMGEVLERRFSHSVIPAKAACLPDGQGIQTTGSPIRSGMTNPLWPLPDLILIDGGKGQLNAAIAAMRHIPNSKFQIPIIGLAKRLEEIFMPGKSNPIILPSNSIALFLLQRIRDEAHRFAIKFHRQLRSKSSLASELDKITGIGPAKKKILLQKFKSASKIKQAEFSELANAVGKKLAQKIKTIL
jgi:excinuclease ABC subunit C